MPSPPLEPGVPRADACERLWATDRHAEMRRYAAGFRAKHPERVAHDPLLQWSRAWEYPFVLDAVERTGYAGANGGGPRVLDAGSGFTFFPYFAAERLAGARITCVDSQPDLAEAFVAAGAGAGAGVAFRSGDLAALEDPDDAYDVVTCVSVLEHVDEPATVLRELRRVLRPGGTLGLTFDVALDGDYPMPLSRAEAVLEELAALFPASVVAERGRLAQAARDPGALTTRRAAARDPASMPWASPLMSTLGSIRHGYWPRSYGYRNLTVWCGALS